MATLAVVNIGCLFSGDLNHGLLDADTLLCRDGKISKIGQRSQVDVSGADVVVDAQGSAVAPGSD
jgi:enamidase